MKAVQATPMSVNDIFSTHEFIVPDFQRCYSWNRDECDKLWDDLVSFYNDNLSNNQTYFLGNLVVYPNSKKNGDVWDIIDGQQRLTTLMMLMRALLEKAGTTEFAFLENRIHKTNRNTDKIIKTEIRLISKVLPEPRSDYNDLKEIIMKGSSADLESNNRFKSNYDGLLEQLTEWWNKNRPKARENFIYFLRDRVLLLPILCESQDDALTLFETINDRGKPLNDADIFKARIYQAIAQKERSQFIQRWNNMDGHVYLFHVYMHILKAREKSGKRSKLKNYIIEKCLNNKSALKNNWKSIMGSLELCYFYKTVHDWADDKNFSAKENVYWAILEQYPNENWQYPLFVFMHRHAKLQGNILELPKKKRKEYLDLLESTARFFFMKGVVYNSIEAVRNISHKVSVEIEEGRAGLTYPPANASELKELKKKLQDHSSYKRYKKGLVFLNSFLNPRQQKNAAIYAEKLSGKIHIEHILPKDWCNYDEWDKPSHDKECEKIGNLIPLERHLNIKASNQFFAGKQKKYRVSSIADAIDLSKKKPARWYPDDLKERHKKAMEQLMKFFES